MSEIIEKWKKSLKQNIAQREINDSVTLIQVEI